MDLIEPRKPSFFRLWVQNMYLENCEEHDQFREPKLTLEEYWEQYKWYARAKFREQQLKVREHERFDGTTV